LAQGGPNFDFQTGPNGRRYAVGGHVNIDTSPVAGDPEATIQKADQIARAARAPAEPSSTDRSVAAKADQLKAQAQRELQDQRLEAADTASDESTNRSEQTADEATNARGAFPAETGVYSLSGASGSREDAIGTNLSLTA
jgi:hypothetical protein